MISDNDKKVLDLIENIVSLSLKKVNDSYFIRGTFSELIYTYEKLEDKNLKYNIKTKVEEILATYDQNKIKKYLNEILVIILEAKKLVETYLKVDKIERSDRYKRDCDRYSAYQKNIIALEKKILNSPNYQKKLHEPMEKEHEVWPNYLHARLTSNLRIMYTYDSKKREITFDAIVTHGALN